MTAISRAADAPSAEGGGPVRMRRWLDTEADDLVEQAYAFDRRGERVAADALLATAARLREIAGALDGTAADVRAGRS